MITDFVIRTFYYFRTGYSIYLSLPLTLISLSTTVYYLAIQNIPILQGIFQNIIVFGVFLTLIVYPCGAVVGWVHFKRAPFYRVEQDVNVESNPYSNTKVTPVSLPQLRLFAVMARERGMVKDAEEMEEIIKRSIP